MNLDLKDLYFRYNTYLESKKGTKRFLTYWEKYGEKRIKEYFILGYFEDIMENGTSEDLIFHTLEELEINLTLRGF